jgi:hypothetical protein
LQHATDLISIIALGLVCAFIGVTDGEVKPDAEHQQDDAEFGELARQSRIADETRRERADGDAGDEVADERGKPHSGPHHRPARRDRADHGGDRHGRGSRLGLRLGGWGWPADGDAAFVRIEKPLPFERPQQHDGARHRKR